MQLVKPIPAEVLLLYAPPTSKCAHPRLRRQQSTRLRSRRSPHLADDGCFFCALEASEYLAFLKVCSRMCVSRMGIQYNIQKVDQPVIVLSRVQRFGLRRSRWRYVIVRPGRFYIFHKYIGSTRSTLTHRDVGLIISARTASLGRLCAAAAYLLPDRDAIAVVYNEAVSGVVLPACSPVTSTNFGRATPAAARSEAGY